jgi:hypothetical protein
MAAPSGVSAQNPGTLAIDVVLTGDPGGDASAVAFLVTRNTTGGSNTTEVSGSGPLPAQSIDSGAYLISASVSDPAYSITSTSCVSTPPGNGPGTPDFTVTGGGAVVCTITAAYTAPADTSTTTLPGDSTTTTTMAPGDSTSTLPEGTTTTVDRDALPPAAGGGTTGAITGTMPVTGPTGETAPLAVAALGMLVLGAGAMMLARRH